MIDLLGFLVITLMLFMCFMGLIIRWNNEPIIDKKEMWSMWWHRNALAIRVCIWLEVWLISLNWFIFLGVILIDCITYPIVINLINGLKWNYLGNTAKIDILIKKIIVWLKAKIKLK